MNKYLEKIATDILLPGFMGAIHADPGDRLEGGIAGGIAGSVVDKLVSKKAPVLGGIASVVGGAVGGKLTSKIIDKIKNRDVEKRKQLQQAISQLRDEYDKS